MTRDADHYDRLRADAGLEVAYDVAQADARYLREALEHLLAYMETDPIAGLLLARDSQGARLHYEAVMVLKSINRHGGRDEKKAPEAPDHARAPIPHDRP